jgi:hypothetical protein
MWKSCPCFAQYISGPLRVRNATTIPSLRDAAAPGVAFEARTMKQMIVTAMQRPTMPPGTAPHRPISRLFISRWVHRRAGLFHSRPRLRVALLGGEQGFPSAFMCVPAATPSSAWRLWCLAAALRFHGSCNKFVTCACQLRQGAKRCSTETQSKSNGREPDAKAAAKAHSCTGMCGLGFLGHRVLHFVHQMYGSAAHPGTTQVTNHVCSLCLHRQR